MENTENKKSFLTTKNIVVTLVVLLVIAVSVGAYFYVQAHKDPQAEAKKELEEVMAQVSKLIVLPENETPTLATVTDPEKLKDQPFFTNAKKGDRVLIYSIARKAILYNPDTDKIVEVAPVNTGDSAPTPIPLQSEKR